MISTLKRVAQLGLTHSSRRPIGHIRNMNEEHLKAIVEKNENEPDVVISNRVYKPTYTIEFNREGEVLIYSGNPIKNETIYFKYPNIFCNNQVI